MTIHVSLGKCVAYLLLLVPMLGSVACDAQLSWEPDVFVERFHAQQQLHDGYEPAMKNSLNRIFQPEDVCFARLSGDHETQVRRQNWNTVTEESGSATSKSEYHEQFRCVRWKKGLPVLDSSHSLYQPYYVKIHVYRYTFTPGKRQLLMIRERITVDSSFGTQHPIRDTITERFYFRRSDSLLVRREFFDERRQLVQFSTVRYRNKDTFTVYYFNVGTKHDTVLHYSENITGINIAYSFILSQYRTLRTYAMPIVDHWIYRGYSGETSITKDSTTETFERTGTVMNYELIGHMGNRGFVSESARVEYTGDNILRIQKSHRNSSKIISFKGAGVATWDVSVKVQWHDDRELGMAGSDYNLHLRLEQIKDGYIIRNVNSIERLTALGTRYVHDSLRISSRSFLVR